MQWHAAIPDMSSKFEILSSDLTVLHTKGQAQGGSLSSITLAADADPAKNFYQGLCVRVVSGPGKSQVARILSYDAENKMCAVDGWVYDKGLLEKALDQVRKGLSERVDGKEGQDFVLKARMLEFWWVCAFWIRGSLRLWTSRRTLCAPACVSSCACMCVCA